MRLGSGKGNKGERHRQEATEAMRGSRALSWGSESHQGVEGGEVAEGKAQGQGGQGAALVISAREGRHGRQESGGSVYAHSVCPGALGCSGREHLLFLRHPTQEASQAGGFPTSWQPPPSFPHQASRKLGC